MAGRVVVELSPEVQAIVQRALDSGLFGTREEVVAQALRAWNSEPSHSEHEVDRRLQEALDRNGPYYTTDEAHARLLQNRSSSEPDEIVQ